MRFLATVVFWTTCVSSAARAAEPLTAGDADAAERAAVARNAIYPKLRETSAQQAVSAPDTQVNLTGERDSQTATAKIGFVRGDELSFDVRLSGPVGSGPDTSLLDLDGLQGSATLDAGFLVTRWTPQPGDPAAQQRLCDAFMAHERRQGRTVPPDFVCGTRDLPEEGGWRGRYYDTVDFGTPVLFGARARVGRKTFEYREATLEPATVERNAYKLTASVGVLPAVGYFGASYQYEVSYRAGDTVELCEPLRGGVLACNDAVLGAPARRERHFVQAEVRTFPSVDVALNPRVTFDLGDGTALVELPVHFLKNNEAGLTGGVIAAWRSKAPGRPDGALGIRVFVGNTFGILPH